MLASGCSRLQVRPAPGSDRSVDAPRVTHGVSVGDVRDTTAVIWARADRASRMVVTLESEDGRSKLSRTAQVRAGRDFTAKLQVEGLSPATRYRYRLWFTDAGVNRGGELDAATGGFATAPGAETAAEVRIAWSGDLGGQNTCRDREEGYPIFRTIRARQADLFIGLGDMIYADDLCHEIGRYGNEQIVRSTGRAVDLESFWAHWRYNRADPAFQALLAETPLVAVWDDHEVINDFGPGDDSPWWGGGTLRIPLLPIGLHAFLDYNPIAESPETPARLYRSLRWGSHVELFALDTRQYRDPSVQADDPRHRKTLLGLEQRRWLSAKLARSTATWKIVLSSVPMAIPTGSDPDRGMDSWANHGTKSGYEHELVSIVRYLRERGVRNNLWITTDVHFAGVYRHTPFPDDPDFHIHEIAVGPLNAGVFGNEFFDTSLGTQRLYYQPEQRERPTDWAGAKRAFNFGLIDVDASGQLQVRIVNTEGDELYQLRLSPARSSAPSGSPPD